MTPIADSLSRGSLQQSRGDGSPAPTLGFSQHRAAITQLLVLDAAQVVSVDREGQALRWDPRTGTVLSRYSLPGNAVVNSVLATRNGGLAYVATEPQALVVHALEDHRQLARVSANGLPTIAFAQCTSDLSRVLVASTEELVLVSLTDGARLASASVSRYEPEILALQVSADDRAFLVHFHHVAMDMYPTDDSTLFDGASLSIVESHAHWPFDPFPQSSPLSAATVNLRNRIARIVLRDERPLPDLVAHVEPLCRSTWIADDTALLTGDSSGTIYRWDLDLETLLAPTQHAHAITAVRFAEARILSATAKDTKLWRDDGELIATLPALGSTPSIDESQRHVIDPSTTVRIYSLDDGRLISEKNTGFGAPGVGARGRIAVGFADAFPVRVISLPDGREWELPMSLGGIVSERAPPIVHAGRLLVTYYTAPTLSLDLGDHSVRAERRLHLHGTSWVALHPDGDTLFSTGYADGQLVASDFLTLAERRRWSVFDGSEAAIETAVLLPERGCVVVAGKGRLRRYAHEPTRARGAWSGTADCEVAGEVHALVADATESRIVVFAKGVAPRVLDVARMTWVDAREGEVESAHQRRRFFAAEGPAHGFDQAFVCGEVPWLVGWSRGLAVTTIALGDTTVRSPFATRAVQSYQAVRDKHVDPAGTLWLLDRNGTWMRTSLVENGAPVDTVATIPGAARLQSLSPTTVAVLDDAGSLHLLRVTGEPIRTIEHFAPSPTAPYAVSDAVAACARPDGPIGVTELSSGALTTLHDPRAIVVARCVALAYPFVASLHHNQVLRWDLRTGACTGAWSSTTTLTAIDVRSDGAVLAGEASGGVTLCPG
ncbi:MAG: WD40 repeat domain-containing protein [Polyangiales bacterium]